MRSRTLMTWAVLAAAATWSAANARAAWIHATVSVKPAPTTQAASQPAAPPPVEYYFNDEQRMAAVINTEGADRDIQFLAPAQGFMDTYSSQRKEIIHSELTKGAILPQDGALPTSLAVALQGAAGFLGTETPNDAVTSAGAAEIHTLTGAAGGPKLILTADATSKALLKIVQETPEVTTTIDYDYRPGMYATIYDFGVQRAAVRYIDNMPSAETRALLDQLDARVEKDPGDGVAVIITDPQAVGQNGERLGHDRTAPYTVEVFARSGDAFSYRVHALQQAPAGTIAELLKTLQDQPATSFVVYDGKTLSQLTVDPQTGKPVVSDRVVKLEPKDFAASNYSRRTFLGREALGTLSPVAKTEIVEDAKARPGQKGIKVTRPTTLFYQDEKNQTQAVPATQLTVYWVDAARGYAPVEYYERRDPAVKTNLKPEVLSTKFADLANTPDGGAIPTRWETGTWDIHGAADFTAFSLMASFGRKLDNAWFAKPQVAAPPAPDAPMPK
jgi:hypothetical protein